MIGFPREALVTLVALAILAQAGCPGNGDGDGDDQPPELPFSGHELSVAAPNGYRLGTSLRPLLDEWSARTGGSIKKLTLIERKPSIVPDRTADNWWPRHTDGADLIVFPLTEIGALMAAGRLGVLKDDRAADDGFEWRDLFIGLRNQAGQLGTPAGPRPVVLPICVPVLVLYVRTDLLEAAGRRPPRTWDEYQSLVEDVEHWAAGLPVIEPWGKSFRSTMFLARAVAHARHPANYSLFFDIRSGEPLIGSPAFVRALEQAAGAVEAMPEAVRSYSPADCRRLILAGRAAMAVTFEPGPRPGQVPFAPGPSVSTAEAVERPGEIQIGFARLPGVREVFDPNRRSWETLRTGRVHAVSLVGFAGLGAAVGAGHDEPIAARDLLELLAVEAADEAFPGAARSPCRESDLDRVAGWLEGPLSAAERQEYAEVLAESLRDPGLVLELPVVGRDRFRAALDAGLASVLDGETDAAKALENVAARWKSIADELGAQTVRDSYRRCLGLPVDRDVSRQTSRR